MGEVFGRWEDALGAELDREEKVFRDGLIEYQDCVASIVDSFKASARKFNNKNTVM